MSRSDVVQIEPVIGPRLDRRKETRNIAAQTETPAGKLVETFRLGGGQPSAGR
jgi:hypothetical protein